MIEELLDQIKQLDDRVDELEFANRQLVDMVDDVNNKYNSFTDELTKKVLRQLTAQNNQN